MPRDAKASGNITQTPAGHGPGRSARSLDQPCRPAALLAMLWVRPTHKARTRERNESLAPQVQYVCATARPKCNDTYVAPEWGDVCPASRSEPSAMTLRELVRINEAEEKKESLRHEGVKHESTKRF
jgi:hypothetical protein